MLRKDEDLDLGVRLEDRPPGPGEQGAVPVALEIIAVATPLGTAFAGVLNHWIDKHKLSVNVRRKGDNYSFQLSGGTPGTWSGSSRTWRRETARGPPMVAEQPPDVRWQTLLVGVAGNAHSENPGFARRSTARRSSRARSSGTCPG